jgi:prepilin-type N-terminal cleavage/methylation domain-containing protein
VRRDRGYTLIELLAVIAIAAILLSMGVGVFLKVGKRNDLEATTNAVRALIRHARNLARDERAPAMVELDAEAGEVRMQARETLTLFRFEAEQLSGDVSYAPPPSDDPKQQQKRNREKPPEYDVKGSYGIQGHVVGADVTDGKLGQGLEFKRPGACVMIPDRPALSPLEGVALEAWICPEKLEDVIPKKKADRESPDADTEKRIKAAGDPPVPTPVRALDAWARNPDDPPLFTIARKGRAYEVALTAGYAIQVAVTGMAGRDEVAYVARTEDLAVRPEKWSRIALAFDGRDLSCSIDGIRRALLPLKAFEDKPIPDRLVRDRAPLVFSDPDPERAFAGVIDEVKLSGIIRNERVEIPKNMALLAPTPEILFDALGGLDSLRHPEPVVFWLSDSDEALALLLPPPAPQGNKTVEKKKEKVDEGKEATDRAKLKKFADLAGRLPERRVYKIAIELTGLVTGATR